MKHFIKFIIFYLKSFKKRFHPKFWLSETVPVPFVLVKRVSKFYSTIINTNIKWQTSDHAQSNLWQLCKQITTCEKCHGCEWTDAMTWAMTRWQTTVRCLRSACLEKGRAGPKHHCALCTKLCHNAQYNDLGGGGGRRLVRWFRMRSGMWRKSKEVNTHLEFNIVFVVMSRRFKIKKY